MDLTELRSTWDSLYRQELPRGFHAIESTMGVVVGFHSVIDGLKRIDAAQIETILSSDPTLADAALAASEGDIVPTEINSPRDFIIGLFTSFSRGKALQLMVRQENTFNWMLDKIGYDFPRMGGTSGNMANSLASLGFPLMVYANPLTNELAGLFVDSPNLKVLASDGKMKAPVVAATGTGVKALHLIVEYTTGDSITVNGIKITTPRSNRFIAAWNPVNNRLQIDSTWKTNFLQCAGNFNHLVVSGFHILSESYPDGSTYIDYLRPVREYILELRRKYPQLYCHYEFASIASPLIRRGIVDEILPVVHSLGLNEVELGAVLTNVGADAEAGAVRREEGAAAVLIGLDRLMRHAGLNRIQLHDLGYYLTLTRPGYAPHVATRAGLVLGATLAASRTATGKVGSRKEIEQGLDFTYTDAGLQRLEDIAHFIGQPNFASTGLGIWNDWQVTCVPTRVVSKPVLTVGLGDLISASSFIAGSPVGEEAWQYFINL